MKILAINCGSSSIKYKLYKFPQGSLLYKGVIDCIGKEKTSDSGYKKSIKALITDILEKKVVRNLNEIVAIGHRVVHGGESFKEPRLVDKEVVKKIKENIPLAPLHNPANLAGIVSCGNFFPNIPQVAVFDTAFYQSMPEEAYLYPVQRKYYKKYKLRKYGFHGTSHQYVAQQASRILKKSLSKLNLITCHLGNGCSITAIKNGKAVDTSMGFTPLEGLMMGTRSGDIDVAAILHIMRKGKISINRMDEILNKESGLLAISESSNDFRIIMKQLEENNKKAELAYSMFLYRIKKYIGAYYFILGGADAVCFTGGIGENTPKIIADVKKSFSKIFNKKIKVMAIPTDEELMIAGLTYKVIIIKEKSIF